MTFARLFKSSLIVTAVAGALIAAPVSALAQDSYYPNQDQYSDQSGQNPSYNQSYDGQQQPQGPVTQQVPPAIPDYQQPPSPGYGYIWTPGYWAWTADGYVWVNGAWVLPPYVNALWTPGYWGWGPYGYFWNAGYWGPYVGYYGGINYGWGYFGVGFYGGYWNHGFFYYNRCYNNFRNWGGIRAVYNRPYRGFNGRPGGIGYFHGTARAGFAGNRGSYVNGRSFNHGTAGFRGTTNFRGAADFRGSSFASNGAAHNQLRYGGSNFSSRSYASAPHANYSGHSYSAPRSFSGGGSFHGNSGGSFHGGGGGGFHGGGGGGFHGGGGGGFHGGGGRR